MKNIILSSSVVLCFFSTYVFAYVGAVSTGTAGSGRAAFDITEAPVLNPAAIAYLKGYFFNTGYGVQGRGNSFNISLTDNLPDTILPSSLQYWQQNQKNSLSQEFATQTIKFGVGNYVGKSFALGFGMNHQIDSLNSTKHIQTNLTVGSLWSVSPQLTFAAVFDNVVEPDSSVPSFYRLKPATSFGLAYNYRKFVRLRFDLETPVSSNSFSQPNIASAIETYWNRWIIIRLGLRKELSSKIDQYGGGLGFVGPKFALHYGYIQSPQDDKVSRHAIDLAVPIW